MNPVEERPKELEVFALGAIETYPGWMIHVWDDCVIFFRGNSNIGITKFPFVPGWFVMDYKEDISGKMLAGPFRIRKAAFSAAVLLCSIRE